MIFKDSVRNSITNNGGPGQKKAKHPEKAYRRYFEGYTAHIEPGKRGSKVRYEYTAEYYAQKLSDRQRLGVKCLYALLYLLSCVGFGLASIAPLVGNRIWYVGIPQAMCVFSLAWMLLALLYYVSAPKHLTIYLRRTMIGFHFHWASICMVISFSLLTLASIVCLIMYVRDVGAAELCWVLVYILCTSCALTIFWVEKRILYLPVKN